MGNSARKHALELDNRDISTLYDRGEELGSGKFATTYAATRRADSLPVAIKVLRKCHHKFKRGKALDEIEAMVCLGDGHPNCVQLIAAFEDGQTISVVEEIVPGGELLDRISGSQSFSERHAAGIIHQVLSGVEYLHSVGITHRDLKPSNILFVSRDPESPDYDRVKICDYGLAHSSKHGSLRSRVAGANPMSTMCGSPLYMAPEIARSIIKCRLSEEQEPEEYTNLVDVWSCGVLLYVMVCGFQPFTEWIDLVKCDLSFDYPEFNNVSDSAKGFIASLLTDADDRMSASSALQDPWLQEAGGDAAASWSPLASTHTLKQTKGILGIRSRLTRVFSPVLRASSRHRKGEVSPFSSSSFLSPHDSQTASARSSPQGSGRRSFADFLSRSSTPSRSRSKFAVTSPQGKSRTWQGADESQPGPLTRMGLFKGARSVDSHSQGVMAKAAADHTLRPVSPLPGGGRETMVPRTKPMSMNISPLRSQFVRSISPLAVRRRKAAAEASPATASTASPAASPFLALSPVAATDSLTPVPLE